MKARNLWTIILFILIAIGAWSYLRFSPQIFIIPAIVIGVVLLLYFYPPQRWRWRKTGGSPSTYHRTTAYRQAPGAKKASTKKRRHSHLRVIQGNKKRYLNDSRKEMNHHENV